MKLPAIHLYPGDWLRDNVAGCSLAAQGLWLRLMFLMHDSDRYGYLSMNGLVIPSESLARRCGCDSLNQYENLLTELRCAGVPEVTKEGVIFSRRMVRDDKKRKDAVTYGKKGGNPNLKGRVNPPPNLIPDIESEDEAPDFCSREGIGEGMRSDGFPDAWRDWIEYRSDSNHGPLTGLSRRGVLIGLQKVGPKKAVEMIQMAIRKSWKNLFEESELHHGQRNNTGRGGNETTGTRGKSSEVESGKISLRLLNDPEPGS